jgi:DNA-binding Lrp family transcriptional regulator
VSGLRAALGCDARFAKLVKSTQSAVPLERDFWPVLARGLSMTVEELAEAFADPAQAPRFFGEPNIALGPGAEALVTGADIPRGAIVRWHGSGAAAIASVATLGVPSSALWPSIHVFKAGLPLLTEAASPADLLAPSRDRTMTIARGEPAEAASLAGIEADLAAYFAEPRLVAPPESPWESIAAAIGADAEAVRSAIRRLVVGRRWRRFAFRFSPAALGFHAALAGWATGGDQATALASQLCSCAGAGDVIARAPEPSSGISLTALFVAPRDGDAAAAADAVARESGMPLALCLDLAIA